MLPARGGKVYGLIGLSKHDILSAPDIPLAEMCSAAEFDLILLIYLDLQWVPLQRLSVSNNRFKMYHAMKLNRRREGQVIALWIFQVVNHFDSYLGRM